MTFCGWSTVADTLRQLSEEPEAANAVWRLDHGQRRSLRAVASRLPSNGVIVADEVGMGKTRIAVATVRAVVQAEGRVVILVPPGLGFQWRDELEAGGVRCSPLLRSLQQYLDAWAGAEPRPWDQEQVVLLSHAFTNWRLGANAEPWRWTMLPALFAQWRKVRRNRVPRNSADNPLLKDPRIHAAAAHITLRAVREGGYLANFLDGLLEESLWPGVLEAGAYGRRGEYRHALEGAVGLGLGLFDLVVVDEAHKSRGDASGLTRLLEKVTVANPGSRRLALTATPVELNARQWMDVLQRIGAEPQGANQAIDAYVDACRKVQELPTSADRREAFEQAAASFKALLDPYLLRRDKRESEKVRSFQALTGEPLHAYRRESAIAVLPEDLDLRWRRAVCAAESLSITAAGGLDPRAQRLRLTMGSGHGINELLDRCHLDEEEDKVQLALDEAMDAQEHSGSATGAAPAEAADKRSQRVDWWLQVIRESVAGGDGQDALMEHPGLRAAVRAIEAAHCAGEKVLVFGRYTRPMRALVSLLNARQMLLALKEERPWGQAVIRAEDEPAVLAASRQLGLFQDEGLKDINLRLAAQYEAIEERQRRRREGLVGVLEQGLAAEPPEGLLLRLFDAFRRCPGDIPVVVRALTEVLDPEEESTAAWAAEFRHVVEAALERDEGDEHGDGALDALKADRLWKQVAERLNEEFGRRAGSFARLMYGKTPSSTRRLLQLAFNRHNSFPRVLVAQSVVGREGLNLHRACRTVVLLHPEWNPGVVEQQIGRVDRLGSHWEQLLTEFEHRPAESPGEVPRIEILPVIFKGTYDEHNWAVLRRRWGDLRAQLHGVVIPLSTHGDDSELAALARAINEMAPNFSPGGGFDRLS
ncbi:DEAD/DEAH box helicase [Variovorax sp. 770b2]|uniref:DEAD/DEAH box helicase n=1 Tax=Variovorax sp. 770b2 TaxID=1566271 RepID=UPI0008F0BF42|nr:DEAD/DEAH box helicase [Variovorax sp. 770b2]SFQ40929.1 SNF2 family N-terminal domain-containing protein [Variovorax sp. 770b2]